MQNIWHVTISPPKEDFDEMDWKKVETKCKRYKKFNLVLECGENSMVYTHAHLALQMQGRQDNIKQKVIRWFPEFKKKYEDDEEVMGVTFVVKKHNDEKWLIGYQYKEIYGTYKTNPKGKFIGSKGYTDKEKADYYEYYIKERKLKAPEWECKAQNKFFKFACDYIHKIFKEADGQILEDYVEDQIFTGWDWECYGPNGGVLTHVKKYPEWDQVVCRLHTLGKIPTTLYLKMRNPKMRDAWRDYWDEPDFMKLKCRDRLVYE